MVQRILSRQFFFCFFAQFAFASVFYILIPTIPVYLSNLGSKEAEIGILVGILSVASLIFRPIVGRELMRIPEKTFMIAGSLTYVLSSLAYLIAKPFWPMMIVRVAQGIGWALFATASLTLVTKIIPDSQRGQGLGYFYMAMNTSFAIAPAFGMLLINHFSFTVLFLVCTGLSLVSLYITLKLARGQGVPPGSSSSSDGPLPLFSRQALLPAFVGFFSNVIWGAVTAFFPLFALSHGVQNPGIYFAAVAVTLIMSRGIGGRMLDVIDREKVILPSLILQMVSILILAFSTTLPLFIFSGVIWGMGSAFLFPSLIAYIIDHAPFARAPAISTYMAFADLGSGLGSVIMGFVVEATSYRIMFLCLALTAFISCAYFYFAVPQRRVRSYANL
jgi:predicted MFS family arabinose efflux permease